MSIYFRAFLALALVACTDQFIRKASAAPPVDDGCRKLVVTIFGRQVYDDDPRANRLFSEISASAHREYARSKKLGPTKEELKKIFSDTLAKYPELVKDDETERNTAIGLFWLWGASLDWVVAKALYEEYGGSIATSSFGAYTSITGRNAIIRGFVRSGDIQFHQPKVESEFWERLKSKRVLDTTITDSKRIKQMFAVSPWQRWIADLDRRAKEENDTKEANSCPK